MKYICKHCNGEVFSGIKEYEYCPFCGRHLTELKARWCNLQDLYCIHCDENGSCTRCDPDDGDE